MFITTATWSYSIPKNERLELYIKVSVLVNMISHGWISTYIELWSYYLAKNGFWALPNAGDDGANK